MQIKTEKQPILSQKAQKTKKTPKNLEISKNTIAPIPGKKSYIKKKNSQKNLFQSKNPKKSL